MTALEELTDLAGEDQHIHIMWLGYRWGIQAKFKADNGAVLELSSEHKTSVEEAARQLLEKRNAIFDSPRRAFASKLIEAPRTSIDDKIPF